MKFFKVFVLPILLGSDCSLEPASLEALSIQAYECVGSLLFTPECLFPPHYIGWTVLLKRLDGLGKFVFYLSCLH